MFTKKRLTALIIPLIIEQFFNVAIGITDIIMVARAGNAAVSGVSLIDSVNNLLIMLLAALATGGAVVAAQYLGRHEPENAEITANQLMITSFGFSVIFMVIALIFRKPLLTLIFGEIDADVMANAQIYFLLSAISYPFIGIYNSAAALFRAIGNSKVSMVTSFLMIILNIIGNAIFIYGFNLGALGVGISSLIARIFSAVFIVILLMNPELPINIRNLFKCGFDIPKIKNILRIGIPNSMENSMFQLGKLMVASLVSTLGTASIAANAAAMTIASFAVIPGSAMGMAMITVIGHIVGEKDYQNAQKYIGILLKISYAALIILNVPLVILAPQIASLYRLEGESLIIAVNIIHAYCISAMLIWPLAFVLPNALRAANDVTFTMLVSIFSMWIFRIVLSYIFVKIFDIGVLGVWLAMFCDWIVRTIFFMLRFKSGKWKNRQYLDAS